MLRSIQELEKLRVCAREATPCGRIKDVYFDDQSWEIKYLVLSIEPWHVGQKQVLVRPWGINLVHDEIRLNISADEVGRLPLASAVLPVCKQYQSLALASPGASPLAHGSGHSDPHLRSARAVTNYRINVAGEFGGTLNDFVFDDEGWEIRYLKIEQIIERRKLQFYILPQAVEQFTWAAQKLLLRHLQPVALAGNELSNTATAAAA